MFFRSFITSGLIACLYMALITYISGNQLPLGSSQMFIVLAIFWSIGFLFVLYFVKRLRVFDSNLFLTGMFVALPLSYILTAVYYPSFVSEFFINYSDKFRYLKGSDLFLVFAIYCLLFFEY